MTEIQEFEAKMDRDLNKAAFEAWVRTHEAEHGAIERGDAWSAWQASRGHLTEDLVELLDSLAISAGKKASALPAGDAHRIAWEDRQGMAHILRDAVVRRRVPVEPPGRSMLQRLDEPQTKGRS